MTEDDLVQIVEIETASFPSPWRPEHFRFEILENRWAVNPVVRLGRRVLAYACLWRIGEELKINDLAVRRDYRRRGLGGWLLQWILDDARGHGCRVVRLEVRPSNRGALALYRGRGFAEVGRRRGYYQDGEDALLMEAALEPRCPRPAREV